MIFVDLEQDPNNHRWWKLTDAFKSIFKRIDWGIQDINWNIRGSLGNNSD